MGLPWFCPPWLRRNRHLSEIARSRALIAVALIPATHEHEVRLVAQILPREKGKCFFRGIAIRRIAVARIDAVAGKGVVQQHIDRAGHCVRAVGHGGAVGGDLDLTDRGRWDEVQIGKAAVLVSVGTVTTRTPTIDQGQGG